MDILNLSPLLRNIMDWIEIKENKTPKKIIEVAGSVSEAILDDTYMERYSKPLPKADDEKVQRYIDEVLSDMDNNSSLLIVGSGHPDLAKMTKNRCNKFRKIGCVDRIREASLGLFDNDISFYKLDVLEHDLPSDYDYIFSSHTLEHFTREELLGVVLPRMKKAALRGVYTVVPLEEAWSAEPTHRCRFYIGDELFCSANKYKIIHNNMELVLGTSFR